MKVSHLLMAVVALQFVVGGAFAQKRKKAAEYMVEPAFEASAGRLFNEKEYLAGKSILNKFENVIVINKAADGTTAQTIRMYSNGSQVQLANNKVSTGKEDVEMVKGVVKLFRKLGGKGTTKSHWRHTTRGFYSVKRVEGQNYQSGESDFHMPYAVFFNDTNGLALHEVPWEFSAEGHEALGNRASSGCVRVHKATIPGINEAVRSAGKGLVPVINTKTGLQERDENGQPKTQTGWKSIVIVEEIND